MGKQFKLSDALDLCMTVHAGQYDKAGYKYHQHPIRVLGYLLQNFPDSDYETMIAALLHDAIEDTSLTIEQMRLLGIPTKSIKIIEKLSKPEKELRPEGFTYQKWIQSIADSNDVCAIRVKLADLMDNSNERRISQLPKEDRGIIKRYNKAKETLIKALERLSTGN